MRDRSLGSTIRLKFTTTDSNGAPVAPSSAFAASDFRIYKDGSATEKTTTNGITVTSPFDSVTGRHLIEIDTSNDTGDNGFWASGSAYFVELNTAKTVNSQGVSGLEIGSFSLELQTAKVSGYASGQTPLQPTIAGRTLDVSATGEAGIDWANIGSPTTAVALTGTTISTSQIAASVTAGVTVTTNNDKTGYSLTAVTGLGNQTANITGSLSGSVGSVSSGVTISGTTATLDALQTALNTAHGAGSWATATGFSTHSAADVWAVGTRTITGGSLTTAPPTAAAIADAVWDEARTGHTTTGTFGYYLDAAISGISGGGGGSTAADIWAYATRTLTSTLTITTDDIDAIVAGVTAAGPGLYNVIRNDDLTLRIGDEFTQAITGLGNLSTRDDLVFTLKASETDADTAAKIYLSENNGLTRLNGATYGTAANGSITVDDATNGDITIRISSAATASLTKATRVDAVKVLESGGNDRTPRVGKTQVLPVIVEARG